MSIISIDLVEKMSFEERLEGDERVPEAQKGPFFGIWVYIATPSTVDIAKIYHLCPLKELPPWPALHRGQLRG